MCDRKDVCGSCGWSDIPYEQQLSAKLDAINNAAIVAQVPLECSKIVPALATVNYRNRMDYVVNYRGEFGLREKGKWWKVVDNHTCFLPDARIIELFHLVYPWVKNSGLSFYDRKANTGLLRYVIFRTTSLGECMVIVLTSTPRDESQKALVYQSLNVLAEKIKVTSLVWAFTQSTSDISFGDDHEIIQGAEYIHETINGYKFIIRPNSFFQTNSLTAGILQKHVLSMVEAYSLSSESSVLDLYCGSGFFTIPLSQKYKNTVGVELVQSAIDDAKENACLNGINPVFICAPTEHVALSAYAPDFILVDPPRAGLHPKVIDQILSSPPEFLIYVSCKYEKFMAEFVALKDKYTVKNCTAIDMFPHTPHVELVTTLVRNR